MPGTTEDGVREVVGSAPPGVRLRDSVRTFGVAWGTIFRAPGLSLTLLLGLGGILLALLSWAVGEDALPAAGVPWVALALLTGLILVTMWVTYHFATPEELAVAAVEGRSAKFILGYISCRIERLCRIFLLEAVQANQLLPEPSSRVPTRVARHRGPFAPLRARLRTRWNDWRDRRKAVRIKRTVKRLKNLLERERKHFLRLDALNTAAAQELGVSSRRLCDHVFQFSPLMLEKGTRRYLSDWRLIECALRTAQYDRQRAHLESLNAEIRAITASCRRRIEEQIRLRRMRAVHEEVVRFAASISTSEALMEYALTLAKVVHTEWPLLRFLRDPAERLRRTEERLAYIHRKQRAHPGYDLHALLIELCRQARPRDSPRDTMRRIDTQIRLLEAIENPGERGWFASCGDVAKWHDALATLPLTILRHERGVSKRIAKRLAERCCQQAVAPSGLSFLVTTGYSRTVLTAIGDTLEADPRARAFLVTDRDAEQLSSRLMKSELRNSRPEILNRVAAGNRAMLLGMLRKDDRVTLLLGTEVFDADQWAGHPQLLDEDVRSLKDAIDTLLEIKSELIVLAARYKAINSRMADSRFYADHFDGVSILSKPPVTLILSEGEPPVDSHSPTFSPSSR